MGQAPLAEYLKQYMRHRSRIGNAHAASGEFAAGIAVWVEEAYKLAGMEPKQAQAMAEKVMDEHFKLGEHAVAIDRIMTSVYDQGVAAAQAFHDAEKARRASASQLKV